MAYPAAAIANEFLYLAKRDGKSLTQMQIQKLVYFAHGWNLAITGEPLVNERFAAWDYGPVVKSLWRAFKDFGSGPITKEARVPDWDSSVLAWVTPHISDGSRGEENEFARALINKVWEEFGGYKAFELSEMTHLPDSPWSTARAENTEFIPDADIEAYFEDQQYSTAVSWAAQPTV